MRITSRTVTITGFLLLALTALLVSTLGAFHSLSDLSLIAILKLILLAALVYELVYEFRILLGAHLEYVPDFPDCCFDLLAILCGALFAFFVNVTVGHGAVLASAVTGLLAVSLTPGYAAAVYCGSFVGMASSAVFGSFEQVSVAAVCSAGIFIVSKQALTGYGGKLGTIAFLGSLIAAALLGTQLLSLEVIVGYQRLYVLLFSLIGALSTYALQAGAGKDPVASSSVVGLAAVLILPQLFGPEVGNTLAVMTFCASFIGMNSKRRTGSYSLIAISAVLSGLLFIFSSAYLHGAGGKLGTIAFASLIGTTGLKRLVERLQRGIR